MYNLGLVVENLPAIDWIRIYISVGDAGLGYIAIKFVQSLHIKQRIKSFDKNSKPAIHIRIVVFFVH